MDSSNSCQQLKQEHEAELRRLREEMLRAATEYSDKIEALETMNNDQLAALKSRHELQLKV